MHVTIARPTLILCIVRVSFFAIRQPRPAPVVFDSQPVDVVGGSDSTSPTDRDSIASDLLSPSSGSPGEAYNRQRRKSGGYGFADGAPNNGAVASPTTPSSNSFGFLDRGSLPGNLAQASKNLLTRKATDSSIYSDDGFDTNDPDADPNVSTSGLISAGANGQPPFLLYSQPPFFCAPLICFGMVCRILTASHCYHVAVGVPATKGEFCVSR